VLFARTEGPTKFEYADVPTIREAVTAGIAFLQAGICYCGLGASGSTSEFAHTAGGCWSHDGLSTWGIKPASVVDKPKAPLTKYAEFIKHGYVNPSQPRYFSIQKWYRENPVTHDFEAWPLDWPQEAFSVIGNSKSGAEVSLRAIDDLMDELAETRKRLLAEVKQEPYQRPPTTKTALESIPWKPADGYESLYQQKPVEKKPIPIGAHWKMDAHQAGLLPTTGYWGEGFGELKRYQMDIEANAAKNLMMMMTREQLVGEAFVKNAMNDLDSMRKAMLTNFWAAQAAAMLAADDEDDVEVTSGGEGHVKNPT
jgi:hypothetical protein